MPRRFLTQLYHEAILAVHPARAVSDTLHSLRLADSTETTTHLVAIGKAALDMMDAARSYCDERALTVAGGIAISHVDGPAPSPGFDVCVGDHPVPSERSAHASARLAAYVETNIRPGDHVIVLLSGGASSLIGAPRDLLNAQDYRAVNRALLGAGLNITDMNLLRRRISRWGGGRLGAALQARGADVSVLAISDVIGNNLAAIGSGPCIPDASSDADVAAVLHRAVVTQAFRERFRAMIAQTRSTRAPATPTAPSPIPHHIIGSNRVALAAVERIARGDSRRLETRIVDAPLTGEAHACGAQVAHELLSAATSPQNVAAAPRTRIVCWGGEPTVTLPAGAPPGGRMQALALSAARVLDSVRDHARGITILAAGTDGRDGDTTAAGAIVDAMTWRAIAASGRNPGDDDAQFRSHASLRAIDALLPAFASGTNVNDVVIAVIDSPR